MVTLPEVTVKAQDVVVETIVPQDAILGLTLLARHAIIQNVPEEKISYRINLTRVQPHPKAGEELPPARGFYRQEPEYYPATYESSVLVCELDSAQWEAVRQAVLGVVK